MDSALSSKANSETGTLPAFEVLRASKVRSPVIFASPHSGQHYPETLKAKLQVPLADLRRTEDAFIDELYAQAVDKGMTVLRALYARSYVDLNRDARELDALMFSDGLPRAAGSPSARVRAGLGCLPRIGASGQEIYKDQITRQEGLFRLQHIHDQYHQALQDEIAALKLTWPETVLIDCHSMPSRQPGRRNLPDIVLGDRFGSSCSGKLTSRVERAFRREGLSVARNAPYAGGYTTRRYGRPRRGTHVLQIEINRGLYLNETRVETSAGYARLNEQLSRVIDDILIFAASENE